jgi:CBS domain-containing protein
MRSGALGQLAHDLRASDIAAFPVVAASEEQLAWAHATMERRDFSHMPVRNSRGIVVSVLARGSTEPIPFQKEEHLIEAAEPLAEAINRLPKAGFLLVASNEAGFEDRISGIINHADVVSLPVRLLLYSGTMQLERHVLDAVTGEPWGDAAELSELWEAAHKKHVKGGERRSCLEAYLGFAEIMRIGQCRRILPISDSDLERLRIARNFAAHAAIDAPADSLRPEVITVEVEECVRLVENLVRTKRTQ